MTCPRSLAGKWQSQDYNPAMWSYSPILSQFAFLSQARAGAGGGGGGQSTHRCPQTMNTGGAPGNVRALGETESLLAAG